jgi:hypothetical protein
MKSLRSTLFVVLISLSTVAFAQTKAAVPQDDAQNAFAKLKTLAGNWEGHATMNPPLKEMDPGLMQISLRVTSRGNALVHEMSGKDDPNGKHKADPNSTDSDHPITLFYLDGDRLLLTHYCDAGNRPRMVGKVSPDGKKVEFTFLDVAGATQHGRMDHAVFTIIDANHHTEDWTYLMPGNKPMQGHIELQRVKELQSAK